MFMVSASVLFIYVAAVAVLDAEQNVSGANITNFADALWWSFVTITTVGYGDFTPITLTGRLVAVSLMIGGITIIGVITASFASWIVEKVQLTEKQEDVPISEKENNSHPKSDLS